MGKWIAGILASVIAALVVWQVTRARYPPPPELPVLSVSSWATPDPVELGRTMDIFVKVLDEQDNPVPDASVQLTPTSGSFLWASAGTEPNRGISDDAGLYTMTFQTVVQVGLIGADPPPANSSTGTISILVRKDGFADAHTELTVQATA